MPLPSANTLRRVAGLYAITPEETDTAVLAGKVEAALRGGAALVQYRNKSTDKVLRREQAVKLTPGTAYDLTFSEGINQHHTTSVADETQSPTRRHLQQLASEMDLPHCEARAAIDQVLDAVGRWRGIAASLAIAPSVIAECERVFRERRA